MFTTAPSYDQTGECRGIQMAEIVGRGLESAARAALDLGGGRVLTDTEWERARAALIE